MSFRGLPLSGSISTPSESLGAITTSAIAIRYFEATFTQKAIRLTAARDSYEGRNRPGCYLMSQCNGVLRRVMTAILNQAVMPPLPPRWKHPHA